MSLNLKRNLLWDYGGRLSTTIFSLITSLVLTRLLNPSDYGLVGIAMAINGVANIFLNLGLSSAIIQKQYDQEQLSTIFWFNSALAAIVALLMSLMAPSLARFFHQPEVAKIIYVNAALLFASSLSTVPMAILTKNMMFKKLNIRNGLIALCSGGLGIFFAVNGWGVWSLVIQSVVNSVLGVVLVYRMAGWLPSFIYNRDRITDGLAFGKFMFFSGLLDGIVVRLDVFIIGKVFSTQTLGLYTRAQSLDAMTRNLSATSLLSVLFPAFAKIGNDKKAIKAMFYNYFELIAFVFFFLAGISFIMAPAAFHLLFGGRWDESAVYFQLLVLSGYAYPISSLMLTVIESQGNSKNFFKAELWKKALFVPVYLAAYFFGIRIFLCALFVACFFGVLVNMLYLKREINVSIKGMHLTLWRYMVSGPGMAIALYFILNAGTNLIMSLTTLILFTAGYIVVHVWLKSSGLQSVKRHIPSIKTA